MSRRNFTNTDEIDDYDSTNALQAYYRSSMLLFRYSLFEACLLACNIRKVPLEYNLNVNASALLRVMGKLKRLIVFIDGT